MKEIVSCTLEPGHRSSTAGCSPQLDSMMCVPKPFWSRPSLWSSLHHPSIFIWDLFPTLGCHSAVLIFYLLCAIFATCLAHFHSIVDLVCDICHFCLFLIVSDCLVGNLVSRDCLYCYLMKKHIFSSDLGPSQSLNTTTDLLLQSMFYLGIESAQHIKWYHKTLGTSSTAHISNEESEKQVPLKIRANFIELLKHKK